MEETNSQKHNVHAFWHHFDELRDALMRCGLALTVGTLIILGFVEPVVHFLERPLLEILPEGEAHLYFTGITDKFFVYLKVSVVTAIGVLFPYLLWEVWRFVSPGLHAKEKHLALPFILLGSLSFIIGLAFGFMVLLPFSYDFLINFGSSNDRAIITLTSYFSLTIKLLLMLGLMFEIPVVLVFLAKLGVVQAETLSQNRKWAILAISILAAVITPTPDAFTMLIVMVPLWLLYELSIIGVKIVTRKKRQAQPV